MEWFTSFNGIILWWGLNFSRHKEAKHDFLSKKTHFAIILGSFSYLLVINTAVFKYVASYGGVKYLAFEEQMLDFFYMKLCNKDFREKKIHKNRCNLD